jgi:plasmid stability protein
MQPENKQPMQQITLRLPESLYRRLKAAALLDNRSISKEALTLLEDGLAALEKGPAVAPQ